MATATPSSAAVANTFIVGVVYILLAGALLLLTRFDGGVAYFWVATPFLIARLVTKSPQGQRSTLLGGFIGCFIATALFGAGLLAALPLSVINTVEVAVVVWLLRQRLGDDRYFDSVQGVVTFVLIAGGLVPMVMSVPAAAVISSITHTPVWHDVLNWYAAHALGTIVCTPMALLILRGEVGSNLGEGSALRRVELFPLFGLVATVTFAVFAQSDLPLLFLPMLPMMIVTMRSGRLGAAGSVLILMVVGGAMTLRGVGPIYLIKREAGTQAQFFQFYVAIAAMLVLPVAALLKKRQALIERLARSEGGYRLMTESSGDAILNLTIDGTILYASPAVRELGGYEPDALIGRNARELVVDADMSRVAAAQRTAVADPGKSVPVQYRAVTTDGRFAWFETNIRAVRDDHGAVIGSVSATRDITARKAVETKLIEAAHTDPLTGLFNRRGFEIQLELRVGQALAGDEQCAVAIFDLDHFKGVNDTHGHAAGDIVLKSFAATAWRTLRDDDIIGRIGGEEFSVVLWKTSAEDAIAVCDRLRAALAGTPVRLSDGVSLIVTASVGVATVIPGRDAAEVLRLADQALYEAKRAGRNRLKLAA